MKSGLSDGFADELYKLNFRDILADSSPPSPLNLMSQDAAAQPCPVGLAVHTASPELGLALRASDGNIKAECWDLGRSLSTTLHDHLSQFVQPLSWTDLDFLAVAQGPGGFTGTRMGVVTARTLAQQLNIPVFAISTLMVLAQAEAEQACSSAIFESKDDKSELNLDVAVEMPARRGAVYGAIYRCTLESATPFNTASNTASHRMSLPIVAWPDAAVPEEKWRQVLDTWPQPYRLVTAGEKLGESAKQLLTLAYRHWQQDDRPHWSSALPFYGQSPV